MGERGVGLRRADLSRVDRIRLASDSSPSNRATWAAASTTMEPETGLAPDPILSIA